MRINNLLLTGIVGIALLASCANEETSVTPGTAEPAVVKLMLSTGTVSSRAGGSGGTSIPIGDGTLTAGTSGSASDEAKINTLCVGIFKSGTTDANKSTVTIQEFSSITGTSVSVTTTTDADNAVAVANAPSGTFAGVKTKEEFLKKIQDLSTTTSNTATANSQTTTNLPMEGECTSFTGTPKTGTVNLTRQVARIAITSITTNFDVTGAYAGASFVPTEIFMYNAAVSQPWGGLNYSSVLSTFNGSNSEVTTSATNLPGGTLETTLPAYSYLSTGSLPYTAPGSTNPKTYLDPSSTPADNPYFFYVYPNTSTTPTKLIIKGVWTSGSNTSIMYYPITINHQQTGTTFTYTGQSTDHSIPSGTDSQINANIRYVIKATIKSIGVANVGDALDPASINLTVSVNPWTESTQDVIFN